ncbi:MAG: hypothetical protein DCF16_12885 [Alphaproteobacteria bacterium]|nr:MAG: hypothetical protein DCF16_12885 [Alphaproteobacteria bacterium]
MTAQFSVRDCVGAALRFVRENLRFVATVAGVGALGTGVIAAAAAAVPQIGLLTSIASTVLQAFVYAALTAAMLFGAAAVRGRLVGDGGRVWLAMAIIGVLMGIVIFVVSIPVVITLIAGPLGPYAGELQTAGSDQAAVMTVMLRFMQENPVAVLLVTLFFFAVWFLLTSRLYLAAPASVDQKRVMTFETWSWTKGNMLRIVGARLMLLVPAYLLTFALSYLIGYGFGIDPTNAAAIAAVAMANPVAFLVYATASAFVTFVLYNALEAGLSAAIYRALKPASTPPAA